MNSRVSSRGIGHAKRCVICIQRYSLAQESTAAMSSIQSSSAGWLGLSVADTRKSDMLGRAVVLTSLLEGLLLAICGYLLLLTISHQGEKQDHRDRSHRRYPQRSNPDYTNPPGPSNTMFGRAHPSAHGTEHRFIRPIQLCDDMMQGLVLGAHMPKGQCGLPSAQRSCVRLATSVRGCNRRTRCAGTRAPTLHTDASCTTQAQRG